MAIILIPFILIANCSKLLDAGKFDKIKFVVDRPIVTRLSF